MIGLPSRPRCTVRRGGDRARLVVFRQDCQEELEEKERELKARCFMALHGHVQAVKTSGQPEQDAARTEKEDIRLQARSIA